MLINISLRLVECFFLNSSLFIIAQSFNKYNVNSFHNLPKNLKLKLLKVLTKRGLINDDNIDKVFYIDF
jgi:hypothetical protein